MERRENEGLREAKVKPCYLHAYYDAHHFVKVPLSEFPAFNMLHSKTELHHRHH